MKTKEIKTDSKEIKKIVRTALSEDLQRSGDVTSIMTISKNSWSVGEFLAKEEGVVAGLEVARTVFEIVDSEVEFNSLGVDGMKTSYGEIVAKVYGPTRSILAGERVSLNFLQRMSGIATETAKYVEAVKPYGTTILDTRKTVPGLRVLDKWAVKLGGGENHRFGLYDMILIKDNHIAASGGVSAALEKVENNNLNHLPVEVEVTNLAQLDEALKFKVDRILLDNMSPSMMEKAVRIVGGKVPLEASGGISLDSVATIAATGVDYISVGALTHSVKALDISLEVRG